MSPNPPPKDRYTDAAGQTWRMTRLGWRRMRGRRGGMAKRRLWVVETKTLERKP